MSQVARGASASHVRGQHAIRSEKENADKAGKDHVVTKSIFGKDKDVPLIEEGMIATVYPVQDSTDVVVTFHPNAGKGVEPSVEEDKGNLPRAIRLTKTQAKNLKKA